MNNEQQSRRAFLKASGSLVGSSWLAFHSPLILAVSQEAVKARDSGAAFETLTAAQAAELDAISAQIIPTDDTPGAREAGVIYFIDGALGSFGGGMKEAVIAGLDDLHRRVQSQRGEAALFSGLTAPQQIEMLRTVEDTPFFALLRYLTVAGMFSLPSYGGNRDKIGWQLVGFDNRHHWQPPFGWYDAQLTKGDGNA
ncbi:MAG: gluconate 2-dehydrogenase subunit 3 family protein [Gammaproteobacteria bacterium]|nr:gluconate 2-dehydrogenase subunit 3 family protein [Gammaproteobacteria bacterium]